VSCRLAIFFIPLFLITGCEKTVINRGYDVEVADFSSIKVGADTVETVALKLGSPTVRSSVLQPNGDYRWYYSAENMTKFGFMKPRTTRNVSCVITFNSSDIVKSVEKSSFRKHIVMNKDTIPTRSGKTRGVFKETFGGMGKYIDKYNKVK